MSLFRVYRDSEFCYFVKSDGTLLKGDPLKTEEVAEVVQTGLMPDQFTAGVNDYINTLNAKEVSAPLTVEVEINEFDSSLATVNIYFTDLTAWSTSSDTDKRELGNIFGKSMSSIGTANAYPNTQSIGVATKIYSPSGLELCEYTILGNVKLNE